MGALAPAHKAGKISNMLEGRPEDAIRNRQVRIVFSTTEKAVSDPKSLRRAKLMQKAPCYRTLSGAAAVAAAIAARRRGARR